MIDQAIGRCPKTVAGRPRHGSLSKRITGRQSVYPILLAVVLTLLFLEGRSEAAAVPSPSGSVGTTATTGTPGTDKILAAPTIAGPVSGRFEPGSIVGPGETIFRFSVNTALLGDPRPDFRIDFVPPAGFAATPRNIAFGGSEKGEPRGEIRLAPNGATGAGDRSLQVNVVRLADGKEKPLPSSFFTFSFTPVLEQQSYLLYGMLGVLFGYAVRVAKKQLESTQPPPHVQAAQNAQAARDSAFVAKAAAQAAGVAAPSTVVPTAVQMAYFKYWYAVDAFVTAIVGFIALLVLMRNGLPPANANFWFNGITIGFALGLLTNTELITKVKV